MGLDGEIFEVRNTGMGGVIPTPVGRETSAKGVLLHSYLGEQLLDFVPNLDRSCLDLFDRPGFGVGVDIRLSQPNA